MFSIVRARRSPGGIRRETFWLEANLHLVVSIAERYQDDHIQILDLIQKGNDGLLGCAQDLQRWQ